MQINFTYEEGTAAFDHILKTTTADGLPVEIGFKDLDADCIYISGHEMEVASDDYKGLYVNFGTLFDMQILPIASVIQQANAQIEDIVSEGRIESRNWDRHVQSFSYPA